MKLLIATISLQLMLLGFTTTTTTAQQQQEQQQQQQHQQYQHQHEHHAEQFKADGVLRPVRVSSLHIPPWIRSDLHLSPNELKLFSGHALGIVRAKCPLVDQKKLFQLQKYIGKIIATDLIQKSDDEASKKSESEIGSESGSNLEIVPKTAGRLQFPELLNTLYRCSQEKEKVEVSKVDKSEKTVANSGLSFAVKDPEGVVTLVRAGHGRDRGEPGVEKGKSGAPNVFLGFQDRDFAEAVKKTQPIVEKAQQQQKRKEELLQKFVPVIELHSVQKNEKAKGKDAVASPIIATITATPVKTKAKAEKSTKKDKKEENSFFKWVSSVFSSMRSVFSKLFSDGFGRKRRSIDFLPSSDSDSDSSADSDSGPGSGSGVQDPEAESESESETDVYGSGTSSAHGHEGGGVGSDIVSKRIKWIEQDKLLGKMSIGALVDEICRLFCGKCHTPQQIRNFRSAGKELMDYVMADENVLIVASHILDEPFLDSIRNCGREIDLTPFQSLLSYPGVEEAQPQPQPQEARLVRN